MGLRKTPGHRCLKCEKRPRAKASSGSYGSCSPIPPITRTAVRGLSNPRGLAALGVISHLRKNIANWAERGKRHCMVRALHERNDGWLRCGRVSSTALPCHSGEAERQHPCAHNDDSSHGGTSRAICDRESGKTASG